MAENSYPSKLWIGLPVVGVVDRCTIPASLGRDAQSGIGRPGGAMYDISNRGRALDENNKQNSARLFVVSNSNFRLLVPGHPFGHFSIRVGFQLPECR